MSGAAARTGKFKRILRQKFYKKISREIYRKQCKQPKWIRKGDKFRQRYIYRILIMESTGDSYRYPKKLA